MYILIEGADGVGKTTQARLLADYFIDNDFPVLLTSEPGGTTLGSILRSLVFDNEYEPDPDTVRLLLLADHVEHMKTVVLPTLEKDDMTVISDRGYYSAMVYQGHVLYEYTRTKFLYSSAYDQSTTTQPDVTLWIDLHPDIAITRMDLRGFKDKNDNKPFSFHEKVRHGFYEHYKSQAGSGKIIRIDGSRRIDEVHREILEAIEYEGI